MPVDLILRTTYYHFKLTRENGDKGYRWNSDINMSFQNKNANGAVKEIVNMVKVNNLSIQLTIKLEDDRVVKFKI